MREPSQRHQRAKALRRAMTPPELALWVRLRTRQAGHPAIRRQHPIGPYTIDFYCASARIAFEVDGWCDNMGEIPERDEHREVYLAERGIRVIRYTASDVLGDADEVALSIVTLVAAPPQSSAPPLTAPPMRGGAENL